MRFELRPEMFVLVVLAAICGGVYAGLPASQRGMSRPEIAQDYGRVGWSLVVFETTWCGACKHFRAHLAPRYRDSEYQARAPLSFVTLDVSSSHSYQLSSKISAYPTITLVTPSGREVERFVGAPGHPKQLFALIDRHPL